MAYSCSSGNSALDVSPLCLLSKAFLCDENWLDK